MTVRPPHPTNAPPRDPAHGIATGPLGALLAALGPLLLLLGPRSGPEALPPAGRAAFLVVAAFTVTTGGGALWAGLETGRMLSVVGILTALPPLWGAAASSPALALCFGTCVLLLLAALLWPTWSVSLRVAPPALPVRVRTRAAALATAVAIGGWFLVAAARVVVSPWAVGGAAGSVAAAGLLTVGAMQRPRSRLAGYLLLGFAVPSAILGLASGPQRGLTLWTAGPVVLSILRRRLERRLEQDDTVPFFTALAAHPARLLVLSFVAVGLVGGGVLALSDASASSHPVPILDALFTAYSAVCVTGLTVQDTATAFSPFGQGVILLLIQLGGLGTMTFAAIVIRALGRRLSLRHEGAFAAALGGPRTAASPLDLASQIVRLSLIIEGIGAVLLTLGFVAGGEVSLSAVWRGVFTAVSAYCNAGFSLQTNSLVPYQQSPYLLHVVSALIILGGLGPLVLGALPAWRRGHPIPLGARLATWTTLFLLVLPFVLYAALEWDGTLATLGWADRLHNAWFQSVTLRTAGFNSVSFDHTRAATEIVMIAAMFIGGSPGSTAGGIKTTTVALLFLAVAASLRGRPDAEAGGRRVPHTAIYRAAAITTVAGLALVAVSFVLLLTQAVTARAAVFEAASALGTVGLSLGATARLDEVGKVIIIVAMLLGRVGPLTLFSLLASQSRSRPVAHIEEDVPVG